MKKTRPYFEAYCARCNIEIHLQKPFCCPKCGKYDYEIKNTLSYNINQLTRVFTRLKKSITSEVKKWRALIK